MDKVQAKHLRIKEATIQIKDRRVPQVLRIMQRYKKHLVVRNLKIKRLVAVILKKQPSSGFNVQVVISNNIAQKESRKSFLRKHVRQKVYLYR